MATTKKRAGRKTRKHSGARTHAARRGKAKAPRRAAPTKPDARAARVAISKLRPVAPVVKGPQLELAQVGDRARITSAAANRITPTSSVSAAQFFGAKNVGTARPIEQHPALRGWEGANGRIRAEGRIESVVSFRASKKLLDALDEVMKRDPYKRGRSMHITSAIKAYIAGGAENVPCGVCGAGKQRAA
jgi:hypothetical protein